jgi:hypothetical protein
MAAVVDTKTITVAGSGLSRRPVVSNPRGLMPYPKNRYGVLPIVRDATNVRTPANTYLKALPEFGEPLLVKDGSFKPYENG